jgi:hypothetical protein
LKSTTWVSGCALRRGRWSFGRRLKGQSHDQLVVDLLASVLESQAGVEGGWAALALAVADQQFRRAWPALDIISQQVNGLSAEAQVLIALIDHQPPEEILSIGGVILQHDEAHRRLVGVDGAVPGFFAEVSLGQGDGIGGNELLLLWRNLQAQHRA